MRTILSIFLVLLLGAAWALADEPEHMTWGHKRVDTRVVPHSFTLGERKTSWQKGKACTGQRRDWAADLAGQIARALKAEGTLAQRQAGKKPDPKADWLLKVSLVCQPKAAELTVTAVEQATGTVVWTKKHSLPRVKQAKETIAAITAGLVAFAKEGAASGDKAGGGRGSLALLPLADRSGRFKVDQLAKIEEHLRQRLSARGFALVAPERVAAATKARPGDVRDETFVVGLADKLEAKAGMGTWLEAEGKQCAFHFLIVPVAADGEDRTAAVQVDCSLLDLKEGISQLVEQI